MPYLKKRQEPFQKMTRILRGYGFNGENLVPVLGYSPKTNRERIRNPEQLTLGDVKNLNQKGHIPMEELRDAISV